MSYHADDISLFMELAAATPQDEFTVDFQLSDEMEAIMKEELDKERRETLGKAARKIIAIMKEASSFKQLQIDRIREARRREKEAKAQLDNLERALAYANETGNYLPLINQMKTDALSRYPKTAENAKLFSVPADWQPKAEPVPAAPTVKKLVKKSVVKTAA